MQWRTCPCYTSMSLLTVLHDRKLILQLRSAVRESLCRSTRATAMAIGPCGFWRFAVDFELLDLHALSNVSAASTATNACVLQSANRRNLLQRKVGRKTWGLILASKKWQRSSIAWRLHCTSTTRCKIRGASRADEVSQPRSAGILVWVTSNMDSALVVSKPSQLFARNKTIRWQNSAALPALTDDGVHPAAMLLSAYRAGAKCRLSQADAAWVRNVIADSENFLPDLLREVPWRPTVISSPAFRASAGRKSCQKPRRPSVAQRKKQLSSLDCVNLLDRQQLHHVYTCRCDLMQCINAWHEWPQYCKFYGLRLLACRRIDIVTLNLADVQKRRDKLKVGPTHEKVWAALRWHEHSQGKRSWHMGRHETRWKELRCEVWRVQCDVWGKCLRDVALHRGCAQVMFLGNNIATGPNKARTHRPGWRTAHASSFLVVLGSHSWKLRWHMRRDEMKCGVWRVQCEVWGVKSAVWSVECEVWTVKCEVWSVKRGLWSVKFGVRRVQCEVWSVKCEAWSLKSTVWSEVLTAKGAVWRVQCEVWRLSSVKCDVELQTWHVKQDTSFAECTRARAWLAHGACKFYRWERSYIYIIYIYIFKATSAPPRAGTTGSL